MSPTWDASWRSHLIDNLETLVTQRWQTSIRDVYAGGSFAEDKDHPNDIDGYFVCPFDLLRTGELTRRLNLLDPYDGNPRGIIKIKYGGCHHSE